MNGVVTGALIGLVFAGGLLLAVWASPPMRPIRLVDRIAPYLGDTPPPSRLLATPSVSSAPFQVTRGVFGPLLREVASAVDRLLGGSASVRRRLDGLRSELTLEAFRLEQVVWGAGGMLTGVVVSLAASLLGGHVRPVLVFVAGLVGLVSGVLGRDWFLSHALEQREQAMLAEFPVIADILALSVVAGESPADALQRVCRLTGGEMARDLEAALLRARAGVPLTRALSDVADATTLEPFARFVSGIVVAIERGTPLADVLRAQAGDVREASKRALLESAGRKEISMMAVVIFLVLPVTVVFALYPGLLTLVSLTN